MTQATMHNKADQYPTTYLSSLAFWCAGLPFIAVHASYLISAYSGQVEWCIPYIDSCTSISNAGRKHPAQIVFKSLLAVTAVLMFFYWLVLVEWLRYLGVNSKRSSALITLMGSYAAFALLLYCITLGSEIPQQQALRRVGIVLFFSLTAFAHLYTVYRLNHCVPRTLRRLFMYQKMISYLLVCLGLISALLSGLAKEHYKQIDDAIEWCFALPMALQFLMTGLMWRATAFRIQYRNNTPEL